MLSKDEVATLESLIRRMSSVQWDALYLWFDDFFDEESCDQPNHRPLQEEIEEAERVANTRLHEAQANPDNTVG
jgi:hypothetical protein